MPATSKLLRLPASIKPVLSLLPGECDTLVVVSTGIGDDHLKGLVSPFSKALIHYKEVDHDAEKAPFVLALPPEGFPFQRLVVSCTGPLNRDQDDIRRYRDAAFKGIKRALSAGGKKPTLAFPSKSPRYPNSNLVTLLGALEALYVPLEIRDDVPSKASKAETLNICNYESGEEQKLVHLASAIECGRSLCRDIGGSDPEKMAPPRVAEYVEKAFAGTCIKVDIISDEDQIQREYPLLAAVNRAARRIERHRARVIFLTYEPEGPVDTTLVLVGKGVTYDTGGADIKAGGVMAGMHRDKCGAAAVAGFFQVLSELKPKGVRVLGGMSMVRNSCGSDGYVADELVTARSGVRVRVGNTDAEGRMVLADVLCHLKEKVIRQPNVHMFTIATLTGHAVLTVGEGYSIVMDNGPAREAGVAQKLQKAGDAIGDMFEISTIRREDYDFNVGKSEYEDVLQCNNAPSSRTPRGHQFPAAFLITVAGLNKHGIDAEQPIKYSHIDIAASSGPFPGIPSGAPIAALTQAFLLDRVSK